MKKGGEGSEECVVLRTDNKCCRLCALPSTDLHKHPDYVTPFTNTNRDKDKTNKKIRLLIKTLGRMNTGADGGLKSMQFYIKQIFFSSRNKATW